MKGKFVIGASLPQSERSNSSFGREYVRYWRMSSGQRLDARLIAAYVENTGREPRRIHDAGLARGQWEYGLKGTDYYPKRERERVLALTQVQS